MSMLTAEKLYEYNCAAMGTIGMTGTPWAEISEDSKTWCEELSKLIDHHFNTSNIVSAKFIGDGVNLHETPTFLEMLANLSDADQLTAYKFLHKIGHRVYRDG